MNKRILIKICGIRTPDMAFEAAKMGADFIGVVFHEDSKRFLHPQIAKLVYEGAKRGGAEVVGVFVNHNAGEMLEICELTGIRLAQAHGAVSRQEAYKLPQNIKRIYAVNVDYSGKIVDGNDKENIARLNAKRDFLLFDGLESGSGKAFDFKPFKNAYDFPFFLAGGLNAANVEDAINKIRPDGVDVSSGVEKVSGEKDMELIKEFILSVKTAEKTNEKAFRK